MAWGVGWCHPFLPESESDTKESLTTCDSVFIHDALEHVRHVAAGLWDTRVLRFFIDRGMHAELVLRQELVHRLGQGRHLKLFVKDIGNITIAITWSNLGISFFDVEVKPGGAYHIQETTCLQLPSSTLEITLCSTIEDHLILGSLSGALWVFDWILPVARQVPKQGFERLFHGRMLSDPMSNSIASSHEDSDTEIACSFTSLEFSVRLGVLCAITCHRQVVLWMVSAKDLRDWLQYPDVSESPISPSTAVLLDENDVTCFAFNDCISELGFGHLNGTVSMLALSPSDETHQPGESSKIWANLHSRSVPAQPAPQWLAATCDPSASPVSSMKFAENGLAVAIGWTHTGVMLFSCETWVDMFSTYNFQMSPSNKSIKEYFLGEVIHVNISSFVLVFADQSDFHEIALAQTPVRSCGELIGQDRVYRWVGGEDFQEVPVPLSYLGADRHRPVRHCSVSSSRDQVAVSTGTGVALYNHSICKWRLFGNSNFEETIHCRALKWYGEYVIIIGTTDSLVMFPRTHLDESAQLCLIPMPSPVVSIDVDPHPGLMVISLHNGIQLLYAVQMRLHDRIYPGTDQSVQISSQELQYLKIQTVLLEQMLLTYPLTDIQLWWSIPPAKRDQSSPSNATAIPSSSWIWSWVTWSDGESPLNSRIIPIGLSAGILSLSLTGYLQSNRFPLTKEPASDMEEANTSPDLLVDGVICENVQRFWLCPFHNLDPDQPIYLWTYSSVRGFQVWFGPTSDSNISSVCSSGLVCPSSAVQIFEADQEVTPLDVRPERGMIIAARKGLLAGSGFPTTFPYYTVQVRLQPYLHAVLLFQVLNGTIAAALDLIEQFRMESPAYVLHSLELLLHSSMDIECSNRKTTLSCTAMVLDFLRGLPEYLECVVRCARKTDFSHWGRLFPLAGTPIDLFEECLTSGRLDSASHYLLVLQRTEGSLIAHQGAVRLLYSVLAATSDDMDHRMHTAVQLMRFLQMSKARNCSNFDKGSELQRRASDTSEHLPEIFPQSRNPSASSGGSRQAPIPSRRPSLFDSTPQPQGWVDGVLTWFGI